MNEKDFEMCYGEEVFVKPKAMLFDNLIKENEWLTTEEASRVLSISSNALRIMVHRDQIQAYKFGRRLRFKLSDCLSLIQRKGA